MPEALLNSEDSCLAPAAGRLPRLLLTKIWEREAVVFDNGLNVERVDRRRCDGIRDFCGPVTATVEVQACFSLLKVLL